MRQFLQHKGYQNDIENSLRLWQQNRFHQAQIPNPIPKQLLYKKYLWRKKREKSGSHFRGKPIKNESNRHCLDLSRQGPRVIYHIFCLKILVFLWFLNFSPGTYQSKSMLSNIKYSMRPKTINQGLYIW